MKISLFIIICLLAVIVDKLRIIPGVVIFILAALAGSFLVYDYLKSINK